MQCSEKNYRVTVHCNKYDKYLYIRRNLEFWKGHLKEESLRRENLRMEILKSWRIWKWNCEECEFVKWQLEDCVHLLIWAGTMVWYFFLKMIFLWLKVCMVVDGVFSFWEISRVHLYLILHPPKVYLALIYCTKFLYIIYYWALIYCTEFLYIVLKFFIFYWVFLYCTKLLYIVLRFYILHWTFIFCTQLFYILLSFIIL